MLIQEFYANREIFITGGTGFLGKALIDKLLRDCPKVKVLYILLREKRNLNATQRLAELKNDKAFERIRKECPEVLSKLCAIEGDSRELGLGISPSNLELLKNVSIIFHMAANVKFDDPLRSSILLNTRGTYELVKIAEKLKNLVVFMHCSTAYCNPFNDIVEEKVYKMPVDWRTTIKIAETYDESVLNALYMKYTGHYPNTYTFSKNLTEQIIQEYSSKLPMFLFRPSIVINAFEQPIPGWIDNMNGPLAALIGLSVGVLPIVFSKPDLKMDCVPVDLVTRMTLVAAYKRGLQTLNKETVPNCLEVVNCASGGLFKIDMKVGAQLYYRALRDNPMENCLWSFELPWATSCYYNFLLHMFLINVPIALVMDNILRLMNRQPLLLKITRRCLYTTKAVSFFTTKEYDMKNENMINLQKCIQESELDIFGSLHLEFSDIYLEYFRNALCGVKHNFFNQPTQATPAARRRYKILAGLNKTIKLAAFVLIIYYIWTIVSRF